MISKLYFHLIYRDYCIKRWFGIKEVEQDKSLLSSIFAMSILQGIHLGTIFNFYTRIFGRVDLNNIYIVAITLTIILASINALIINRKGFVSIENSFLKVSPKIRRRRDITAIAWIVISLILFDISLPG